MGGGHLFPVPRLWGWSVYPPSSILLMLPLQIQCSLVVAKLMSNSCAPPPLHRPATEKLKRELQSLECYPAGAYVIGSRVNEKVQNTGDYAQFFYKLWALLFSSIFFQILSSPPPSPYKGSAVFLNIGLTQTCIKLLCLLPT